MQKFHNTCISWRLEESCFGPHDFKTNLGHVFSECSGALVGGFSYNNEDARPLLNETDKLVTANMDAISRSPRFSCYEYNKLHLLFFYLGKWYMEMTQQYFFLPRGVLFHMFQYVHKVLMAFNQF